MTAKSAAGNILAQIKQALPWKANRRQELLERLPKSAVGAEIGVWKGNFSRRILQVTSPRELHLIDPWEFQSQFPERMYGGKVAKKQQDMDEIYRSVRDLFQANQNVKLHRGYSATVLEEFEDGYFDWVYIDGNHYYDYVLKDLEICFLKVKPGGVIAGDDYTWGVKEGFPVQKAVQNFIKKERLEDSFELLNTQYLIRR